MARVKDGKRHPPFGATKKQAEASAEVRDLKNRIFELENRLSAFNEDAYRRGVSDGATKNKLSLSKTALQAIRAIADVPMRKVVGLRLVVEWQELCRIVDLLDLIHAIDAVELAAASGVSPLPSVVTRGEWKATQGTTPDTIVAMTKDASSGK